MKHKLVSLYSGCGGLDLGLEKAGFTTVYANDLEPLCEEVFKLNMPHTKFYTGGVLDYLTFLKEEKTKNPKIFEDIDLLAGGPPCPPFSKSRFYLKDKPRALKDPKGEETVSSFFEAIKIVSPKAFLFENVAGITFKSHRDAFDYIITRTKELDYKFSFKIINTANYGVPQIRQRFFLVGTKFKEFQFPIETHSKLSNNDLLKPWVTSGEVLNDLDTLENDSDEGHFAGGKDHKLLCEVPPGQNYLYFTEKRGYKTPKFKWRSRYWSFLLKLDPKQPSWTIQARRSNNMGPFHWKNRILRIKEVKRLQTFPDDWKLAGTIEQQWRQIGNAVPPLIAEILGRDLMKNIDQKNITCNSENIEKVIY